MGRHIFIGGVDRWKDYVDGDGPLTIANALSYTMDTCSFSLRGPEPAWGASVIVEDDDLGRLFAGTVQVVTGSRGDPLHPTRLWTVECDDYTGALNQKTVVERYENVNATEAFLDLATRYAPDFSVAGIQDGEEVIEYLDLIDVPVGDAFTAICEYVGWHWFPDYFKVLHFFSLTAPEPAPMVLIPGGRFTDFTTSVDGQGVKNRILVRGGSSEGQAPIVRSWLYVDGATEWVTDTVPRRLVGIIVSGGLAKTVGWDGLDDPALFDFMANPSSRTLKSNGSVSLVPGDTIAFTYYPEVPIVLTVDDLDSQAAMAAILGGDGVLEDVFVDESLTNLEQAMATGRAELRRWANPRIQVTFRSHTSGWKAGQVVTVDLADRGVVGDFIIQEAILSTYTTDDWVTEVTAGGFLFGLADFIAGLATKQKAQRPTESVMLNRVQNLADALVLSELVTVDTGTMLAAEVGTGQVGLSEVA